MGGRSELLRLMKALEARKAAAPSGGAGINFDALASGDRERLPAELFERSPLADPVARRFARGLVKQGGSHDGTRGR
jgi:hypothetical protein